MARKTITAETLRDEVNSMLAESTCSKDTREGMIAVLEKMLMSTKTYNGYRYLRQEEVPAFEKPGIRLDDETFKNPDASAKFANTDHTRVHYF